ncbi:MAG: phosphatase PAP2 family protein [Ruminococcaceae bacterium]|nr:phosphatase PAP2 family protein [Oscillospiraceae bacterium]
MKRKLKIKLITGLLLLVLFVLFTLSLRFVDLRLIGPLGSRVAYGGINEAVHSLVGVNMILYTITDWAGVAAIAVAFGFALLGLTQWVKRKSLKKVDCCILALGGFYILVFGAYTFFEFCVINYRPVLINGILEGSYPSSTTMLAACVFPSAMMVFRRIISKPKARRGLNCVCALFTAFMVLGRFFSGVHWFTDIVGGLLFSAAGLVLFSAACEYGK